MAARAQQLASKPSQYERVSSVSSEIDQTQVEVQSALADDGNRGEAALFGAAGLLNNVPYVIMLACAKNISEGGVAAVYISSILPGLAVKLTAPYWFDHVSYHARLMLASLSMCLAFATTAFFGEERESLSGNSSLAGQLTGVSLISFQCGLGEASLLALAGKCDSRRKKANTSTAANTSNSSKGLSLTAFSSGTGLAGPVGYLWKVSLTEWFKWSVPQTLFTAAVVLALLYAFVCRQLVHTEETNRFDYTVANGQRFAVNSTDDEGQELVVYHERANNEPAPEPISEDSFKFSSENNNVLPPDSVTNVCLEEPIAVTDMNVKQRFQLVLSCWPYMVPLFAVYAAEYACQAGAWTAIGFPVESKESRAKFYEQSNWLYQAGVFLSRSSGTLFTVNMVGLWIMPVLQLVNLIVFSLTAAAGTGFLYNRSILLIASLYTGLLGGAVYVHGYKRIVADVPTHHTEFALASTSVAEGLGVLVADVASLFLQSCLYRSNGLAATETLVQCPL